jgi:peptidoglycan/xylan/chitin deacetylase (PgdA/CDA1 family)
LNYRIFNILYIVLIICWIRADRHFGIGSSAYGWILLLYFFILFLGSYFIQLRFFLKSVCSANTSEKCIALSFDDGPGGNTTSQVLDILKENNVQAAFFCIGEKMTGQQEQLKRILKEGHIIGNHSYSHHRFFSLFSPGKMLSELEQTRRVCQEITGFSTRFFRPPYGVTNPNLRKAVLQGGYLSVGWSIRSYDTVIKNDARLIARITSSLKPGAILLLHDTMEITIRILPRLLKEIRDKGYQIERLDKLINSNPYV